MTPEIRQPEIRQPETVESIVQEAIVETQVGLINGHRLTYYAMDRLGLDAKSFCDVRDRVTGVFEAGVIDVQLEERDVQVISPSSEASALWNGLEYTSLLYLTEQYGEEGFVEADLLATVSEQLDVELDEHQAEIVLDFARKAFADGDHHPDKFQAYLKMRQYEDC